MLTGDRLRSSLLSCLLLTGLPRIKTAELLTALAKPSGAVISPDVDIWMPRGLMDSKETTLIDNDDFLDNNKRKALSEWWLVKTRGANKPNWDIASSCTIEGISGLVLIEAKAHDKELNIEGKSTPKTANGLRNHDRIGAAIEEACTGLNLLSKGCAISRDSHYQLSNRFAWSWKLAATLGVPVVLIYLGFVNAMEMTDQGQPFNNAKAFEMCILNYAKGIVPDGSWDKRLDIGGIPAWFLIRSMELSFSLLQ